MSFRSRFGSGFPFDDNEDRGLRARLAERHPEFAEHLNPDTWGRSRTGSGSSTAAGDDPFARFRNRARFQDFFGSPFEDEFDDPRLFERYCANPQQQASPKNSQPEGQQQQAAPSQQAASPQQQQQPQPAPTPSKPPTAADAGKKKIQQSSTVDLGQPQTPLVDETRTHRSMSAPPEHPNRTSSSGKQRYVSSVNIPNVNADKMGGSASQPQQQQAQQQPQATSKEHIIPIHIEGRDEVVMPSTAAQQGAPSPQPERIFGQRPGMFTKYVNPQEASTQDDLRHQEELRRQQQQQKYQEFMRQQQAQQAQQEQPPQQPTPAAPKPKPSSLELIQNIQKDVSALMTQVENFDGKTRDKKYLYLDEMLTRKMLQLDDIETGGQDAIRKARKEAIKCIQDTIKVLESKAAANDGVAASAPAQKEATPTPAEVTPAESAPAEATTTRPTDEQPTPAEVPPTAEEPSIEKNEPKTESAPAENQELLVGGVARSGSQATPMEVDGKPDEPASEQPAEVTPASADEASKAGETVTADGGATEKKRVKKKAEKK